MIYQPIGDNILVKVSFKKIFIILPDQKTRKDKREITNIEVLAIGEDVIKVKVGDKISIDPKSLINSTEISVEKVGENEVYLIFKELYVIAIVN